jgi:ATP-dependent DNA helicase DinG
MQLISQRASNGRIIAHDPAEISTSPGVSQALQQDLVPLVADVAENVQSACEKHAQEIASELEHIKEESDSPEVRSTIESARNYLRFIRDFAHGAHELSTPPHASVSSVEVGFAGTKVKREYFDLKHPLTELLWKHKSYACLSATMQLDGEFEFFTKLTGATGEFCEVLGSPFDFGRQMSIYLPEPGLIPDPTLARSNNSEPAYYHALAREISSIIEIMEGKTLVLFHSRKEMQAVRDLISISDEWPILMQESRGVGSLGEQFKKNIFSSLFALRSFWTGFDAPGETCSCVVLVRIPFEVPIEPIQLAKMAYIQMNGEDPFATHSLSNAKMIMRQGAGRLIRSLEDRGVLALLDPRLRTKRYGESIMANFPPETRVFSDFADAAGWVGL